MLAGFRGRFNVLSRAGDQVRQLPAIVAAHGLNNEDAGHPDPLPSF